MDLEHKSFSARTTGKWKRQVKKSVIPGYGKKGAGYVKNPKKAIYNKVYNKTSTSSYNLITVCLFIIFLPFCLTYIITKYIVVLFFKKLFRL